MLNELKLKVGLFYTKQNYHTDNTTLQCIFPPKFSSDVLVMPLFNKTFNKIGQFHWPFTLLKVQYLKRCKVFLK